MKKPSEEIQDIYSVIMAESKLARGNRSVNKSYILLMSIIEWLDKRMSKMDIVEEKDLGEYLRNVKHD